MLVMPLFRLTIVFILLAMAGVRCHAMPDSMLVMCYNVENLFDCVDDSLKDDDEFLPHSIRAWHTGRFKRKMANLSRAVINSGHGCIPAIVGLCEVENDYVMHYLTAYAPLKQLGYRYVMTDSRDSRGIDVAVMYQREKYMLISANPISADISATGAPPTRDMLHCSGRVATGDTLDVIVCHLPSRRGGSIQADRARGLLLKRMREYADSVRRLRHHPNVVMMGDFNMEANDSHLTATFGDGKYSVLTASYVDSVNVGSYKYRALWQTFDHIIVNREMCAPSAPLRAAGAKVVDDTYLLENDDKYFGLRPCRTYYGMRYKGGYSDHLPVVTVLRYDLAY